MRNSLCSIEGVVLRPLLSALFWIDWVSDDCSLLCVSIKQILFGVGRLVIIKPRLTPSHSSANRQLTITNRRNDETPSKRSTEVEIAMTIPGVTYRGVKQTTLLPRSQNGPAIPPATTTRPLRKRPPTTLVDGEKPAISLLSLPLKTRHSVGAEKTDTETVAERPVRHRWRWAFRKDNAQRPRKKHVRTIYIQ